MEYKKILIRLLIAFAVLFSADFTYQSVEQTHQSHAAVNYYSKNQCTWWAFKRRAQVVNLFLIDGAMLKIGITMHVNQNMRLVVHQENLLSCNQLQDIMDMSQLLNKYIKTVVLKFQNTTFIAH